MLGHAQPPRQARNAHTINTPQRRAAWPRPTPAGSSMTKSILPFLLGAVMPLLVVGWLLVSH
jgi:hypothetical protein